MGLRTSGIHCLEQNGIAAYTASCIFQLYAEMLAAPDNDEDDPFLTSDDDEDELEENKLTVEDTDWFHLVTYFFAQAVYCT